MVKIAKFYIVFFFIFYSFNLYSLVVGSYSDVALQSQIFFSSSDEDNTMQGFSFFRNGFTLQDSSTTCTFDAFYNLSGDIVLNGGTLYLEHDVQLDSPYTIGPGVIDADFHSVKFLGNGESISLPSQNYEKLFQVVGSEDITKVVTAAEWSFDDKYLAVTSYAGAAVDELKIYYVVDGVLTLTNSADLGNRGNSVDWHPSEYYLAVGRDVDTGGEFRLYYLDVPSGILQYTDSTNNSGTRAVSWDPSGQYVAAGLSSDPNFYVAVIYDGIYQTSYSTTYSTDPLGNRTVWFGCVDWDSTGSYIAVGLDSSADDSEVKIFYFNGSSVTENAELELGYQVRNVRWLPNSSFLAVSFEDSSEQLRIYEHDSVAGTLTEYTSARIGENELIYSINWSDNGIYLIVGKESSVVTNELRIFEYDSSLKIFKLVSSYSFNGDISWASFSHSGEYISVGQTNNTLTILKQVVSPLVFKDVELYFITDIIFSSPIVFEGSCSIDCSGHSLSFSSGASIIVKDNSSLILEDAVIKGIDEDTIGCATDSSLIVLKNSKWYQDSTFTFSVGSLQFENDVLFSGDNTFVYSSSQTSTILSEGEFTLSGGITFSYDPGIVSKDLLEFEDESSTMILHGASFHATETGFDFKKGNMIIKEYGSISSDIYESSVIDEEVIVGEGITFGDETEANDFICYIYPGSTFTISSGHFDYKNVLSSSWVSSYFTSLYLLSGTSFCVYKSLDIGDNKLYMSNGANVHIHDGEELKGIFITTD